jgi:hypothetical protein
MDSVGPEISLRSLPMASALLAVGRATITRAGVTPGSTTFVQTVSTIMGFTSGFLSLVGSRFGGSAANVSVRQS